jgi:hypothetical protein
MASWMPWQRDVTLLSLSIALGKGLRKIFPGVAAGLAGFRRHDP